MESGPLSLTLNPFVFFSFLPFDFFHSPSTVGFPSLPAHSQASCRSCGSYALFLVLVLSRSSEVAACLSLVEVPVSLLIPCISFEVCFSTSYCFSFSLKNFFQVAF